MLRKPRYSKVSSHKRPYRKVDNDRLFYDRLFKVVKLINTYRVNTGKDKHIFFRVVQYLIRENICKCFILKTNFAVNIGPGKLFAQVKKKILTVVNKILSNDQTIKATCIDI